MKGGEKIDQTPAQDPPGGANRYIAETGITKRQAPKEIAGAS